MRQVSKTNTAKYKNLQTVYVLKHLLSTEVLLIPLIALCLLLEQSIKK